MTDPVDPPDRGRPPDPGRSWARQVPLAVLAFVATLALLFGLASLVARSAPSSDPPSASIAGVIPTRPGASRSAVASLVPSATVAPSSRPASPSPSTPSSSPSVAASQPPVAPTRPPAPPTGTPDPVLVGAGDIADCDLTGDTATANLVAKIPGTVFTAGDNAYPDGSRSEFRDCYGPTWGRFLDRTKPAPGNHDHETQALAGYLGYFGAAAAPEGKPWYSYDLGTWHIVVLDSNCDFVGGCGRNSLQGRWLASDLAASAATCTMAIWHHPRWSSGGHGSDPDVGPFWDALSKAGADVVVNGHDHDYERFAPQDPDARSDPSHGIREFVVGTGGAALRSFAVGKANSQLRLATSHGIIRFDLRRDSYDWTFMPTTGSVTDSGRAPCH